MKPRAYKILVIDDEVQSRRSQYKLLQSDSALNFEFLESSELLSSIQDIRDLDGYLIDLNLEKWGLSSAEVVQKYIAPLSRRKPIFLLSAYLHLNDTTRAMQAVREANSGEYADVFVWRDLADDSTGAVKPGGELENVRQRMLRRLGDWYRRSDVHFSDGDLRVLHLSDPQFGDPHLNGGLTFNEHLISEALTEKFAQSRRPDASLVDIVVISGDITLSGQKSEFDQAKIWIETGLLRSLWPTMSPEEARERLLIVPGNHDANLRALACQSLEYNFKWSKDPSLPMMVKARTDEPSYKRLLFQNYIDFLRSIDSEAAKQVKDDTAVYWTADRFAHAGFQFLMLNTAGGITCEHPSMATVFESELRSLGEAPPDAPNSSDLVRICIGHHPIKTSNPKEVALNNGAALLPLFAGKRVVAYLHGHSHEYGADEVVQGKTLAVMSSTSNVDVVNGRQGFNLVTVKRKQSKGRLLASGVSVEICEFHKDGKFNWLAKHKREMRIKA